MSRRTLVVGYYGMLNFGDDLFCHLVARCRPRIASAEELVIAGPPLPGLATRALVPAGLAATFRAHTRRGAALRAAVAVWGALSCSRVVLGGGSVLQRVHGVRRVQLSMPAPAGRRRWSAVGVSVGPFETTSDRDDVEHLLRRMDDLVVRDEPSLLLAPPGAEHGGDLAALVPHAFPGLVQGTGGGPVVVIPKRGWGREMVDAVAYAVCSALPAETPVVVACLNAHPSVGDTDEAASLHRALVAAGCTRVARHDYGHEGVEETVRLLAGARAVVSGRLHGAIVAYVLSVPMVLTEDVAKMTAFLDDIDQPSMLRVRELAQARTAIHALLSGAVAAPDPTAYRDRARTVYGIRADG